MALVVTIIILIILATITINMAFGEGGIIEKAQQAKNLTEQAVEDEQESLNSLMKEYANIMAEDEEITEPIDPDAGIPIEDVTKGNEFEDTTKIEAPVDSDGDNPDETGTIYVPGGFGIDEESPNDISDGIVISNADDSKQFVWIPVNETELAEMYENTETELSSALGMDTVTTDRYSKLRDHTTGEIMDTNTYKPGTTNYREPDILTSTSNGDAKSENITTIKTVFKEELEKAPYNINSSSSDAQVLNAWAQMLVDEYNATYESIATYGGFYIGRYEISGSVKSPTVKREGTVLTAAPSAAGNWYNLKKACNNVVNNENAVSEMIYGNQWDRVLNWLVETGMDSELVYENSSSWGNYSNYNDSVSADKRVEGAGIGILPAGTSEYWKANNIYDLAGNAFDWTQEARNTYYRVGRGGYYSSTGSVIPASVRRSSIPGGSYSNYSARVALYVALDAE